MQFGFISLLVSSGILSPCILHVKDLFLASVYQQESPFVLGSVMIL